MQTVAVTQHMVHAYVSLCMCQHLVASSTVPDAMLLGADTSKPPRLAPLQGVLGERALQGSNVMVHPFLVAGWAGLVSTSLNLLPVGSIDGGRIVQVRQLQCCCGV